MADIERRTRLARLMISSPEVVYEGLKAYSADVHASPYTASNELLENSLAERDDPLIDLGLATFGSNPELVGNLYRKGKEPGGDERHKQGLRLAVLGNETVNAKGIFSRFPGNTLGEEEVAFVLKQAGWSEAETRLLNPEVSDEVLLALYRGVGVAEGLDDDRRRHLVTVTGSNPRLTTNNDNDDGPDMGHWDLHKAIFEMLETVPTSNWWASDLRYFLMRLDPSQVKRPDNIDAALERWQVDENGATEEPDKNDQYNETGLSNRMELRCVIAALYGESYGKKKVVIHGTAEDEDVARRCVYYGNASLDVKAIESGYEKDKNVFVFAAMMNDDIFLNKKTRKFFEEECLNGGNSHRYKARCEQLHKRRKWFDPRPTAEWMVDDEAAKTRYATEQQVLELHKQVNALQKSLVYLPYVLGGLFALALWKG